MLSDNASQSGNVTNRRTTVQIRKHALVKHSADIHNDMPMLIFTILHCAVATQSEAQACDYENAFCFYYCQWVVYTKGIAYRRTANPRANAWMRATSSCTSPQLPSRRFTLSTTNPNLCHIANRRHFWMKGSRGSAHTIAQHSSTCQYAHKHRGGHETVGCGGEGGIKAE